MGGFTLGEGALFKSGSLAPVGVPHVLPEADEHWVVGCGDALNGGANRWHGVEELEQFAEVFGVGDNDAFVVGGDPPGSVAVDHCLVHVRIVSHAVDRSR